MAEDHWVIGKIKDFVDLLYSRWDWRSRIRNWRKKNLDFYIQTLQAPSCVLPSNLYFLIWCVLHNLQALSIQFFKFTLVYSCEALGGSQPRLYREGLHRCISLIKWTFLNLFHILFLIDVPFLILLLSIYIGWFRMFIPNNSISAHFLKLHLRGNPLPLKEKEKTEEGKHRFMNTCMICAPLLNPKRRH